MKRFVAVAIAASLFITVNADAFLNGSFETGDFSGWTFSLNASVVSTAPRLGRPEETLPDWQPTEGHHFAYLEAGEVGVYTLLSQSFTANPGDRLEFDIFFDTEDYLGWDDNGYASLQGGAEPIVLYYQSVSSVGDFGSDGWTHISYTFYQAGEYSLEFGVKNVGDNQLPSGIGVDHVTLVPEPCTLLLLGAGGLIVRKRRSLYKQ